MPKEWLQKLNGNEIEFRRKMREMRTSLLAFERVQKTIYKEINDLFNFPNTYRISNSYVLAYFIEKELLDKLSLMKKNNVILKDKNINIIELVRQELAIDGIKDKVGEILTKYPVFSQNDFYRAYFEKNAKEMVICNQAIDGIIKEFVSVIVKPLINKEISETKKSIFRKISKTISKGVNADPTKDEKKIAGQIAFNSLYEIIDNSGCSIEIINDIYMQVDKFLSDNPNALAKILSKFSNRLNPTQEGVLKEISNKLKSSFLDEIIGKNKFSNAVTNALFKDDVSYEQKLVGKKLSRHIEIMLKDSIEEKDKFPEVRNNLIKQLENDTEVKAKMRAIIEKYPQITEKNFFQKEGACETIKRITIAIASLLLVGLPFAFKPVREAVVGSRVEDVRKEIKQEIMPKSSKKVNASKGEGKGKTM